MDIEMQKKQLRDAARERYGRMREQDRQSDSRSICRRILQLISPEASCVAVYFPMKNEPDILPLIQTFLERGMSVFMPRAEEKLFAFRQVESLEKLVTGPFGILEPADNAPLLDPTMLEYVLVPGMAFDYAGHRMGRGNGGYDRWITQVRSVNKNVAIWGLALECQIFHDIPVQPHDQMMDMVITPRGKITS